MHRIIQQEAVSTALDVQIQGSASGAEAKQAKHRARFVCVSLTFTMPSPVQAEPFIAAPEPQQPMRHEIQHQCNLEDDFHYITAAPQPNAVSTANISLKLSHGEHLRVHGSFIKTPDQVLLSTHLIVE